MSSRLNLNLPCCLPARLSACLPARRIPSDGNAARYIEKPNGCTAGNTNSVTGDPCLYTPEMRRWDYFKKVVSVPDTSQTAGKFDFSGFKDGNLWVALITFL